MSLCFLMENIHLISLDNKSLIQGGTLINNWELSYNGAPYTRRYTTCFLQWCLKIEGYICVFVQTASLIRVGLVKLCFDFSLCNQLALYLSICVTVCHIVLSLIMFNYWCFFFFERMFNYCCWNKSFCVLLLSYSCWILFLDHECC